MTGELTVRDNPESRSYDAVLDGKIVGTIVYEHEGGTMVWTHTIVQTEHQAQGIGTQLVQAALDDVRARHIPLKNFCSFVSAFVADHPAYADLITA